MPRLVAHDHRTLRRSVLPGRRPAAAVATAVVPESRLALPVLVLVLAGALLMAGVYLFTPGNALAATGFTMRCDGVLRTKPTTSSVRKVVLKAGTRIGANAVVNGGSWTSSCGGQSRGRQWYRIVSVNGKSVQRLYGRSYLYVKKSLLKQVIVTLPLQAACDGVRLRTGTSTSTSSKATLSDGTKVTANGTVAGGSYSTSCVGANVASTAWYRITAVNGRSVSSLYGVSALYGAKPLFEPQGTPDPPAPTPRPTPAPTPKSGYIEGIDVSHWQGTIDWAQVAAAGKRFAFLKASDSTDYVDPTYATNRAQAKANGILIGAYHFARPDATAGDAIAEADHFVDTGGWVGGELLPVLDLEQTGGLTTAQLQAWVQAFLDRVYARTGERALIYVSPSFWSSKMGNTQSFAIGGYKMLWIAHWTTASSPTVPASNWGGNGWTFWQYTSSGSVPGISGNVDLDRYKMANFDPVLVK